MKETVLLIDDEEIKGFEIDMVTINKLARKTNLNYKGNIMDDNTNVYMMFTNFNNDKYFLKTK